jgi:hypothetical protein
MKGDKEDRPHAPRHVAYGLTTVENCYHPGLGIQLTSYKLLSVAHLVNRFLMTGLQYLFTRNLTDVRLCIAKAKQR